MSRDVYGKHYDDLSEHEQDRIAELMALQMLENEEMKERMAHGNS